MTSYGNPRIGASTTFNRSALAQYEKLIGSTTYAPGTASAVQGEISGSQYHQDRFKFRQRQRQRQKQRQRDRSKQNYSYTKYKIDEQQSQRSRPNTTYKSAYFKDNNDYHYHSKDKEKDNLSPLDSIRQTQQQGKDLFGVKQQLRQQSLRDAGLSRSPSFRRGQPLLLNPSSRHPQFIDSIQNIINSHRSLSSQQSASNYPQFDTEQILYLKEKLVQTHHKLLKQLETSNRLAFDLQILQVQFQQQQKQKNQFKEQLDRTKKQLEALHLRIQDKYDKQLEKYRSIQNKAKDQQKRNAQLKDDMEGMRSKMLQTLMIKNNLEQQNANYKAETINLSKIVDKLSRQNKQKQQEIEYLHKQLQVQRRNFNNLQKQCIQRSEQLHQYNHLAAQRQKTIYALEDELKAEKQRNHNNVIEFGAMQSQHKSALNKIDQLQEECEKFKGEIYWLQKNREQEDKGYRDKLMKATQDFNVLNIKLKEKERQIQNMKRRHPVYEQKKRKNYENTKQFVNRLETQQSQISNSRLAQKTQSKGSGRKQFNNQNTSQSPSLSPTARRNNPSKSTSNTGNKYHGNNIDNPITHEPITHRQSQQGTPTNMQKTRSKQKFISMLSQVGELQADLLSYNMEKKRMLQEMDKIDDTKVKTKDMIAKRRKLQNQITAQDNRIQKTKQQLKKAKAT